MATTTKKKIILSINAGSSSVKVSVFSAEHSPGKNAGKEPLQLAEISLSGLTSPPCKASYSRGSGGGAVVFKDKEVSLKSPSPSQEEDDQSKSSQEDAFRYLLDTLVRDDQLPEVSSAGDVDIACHRVVHGGGYTSPRVITRETYHHLEELTDLAPLHNSSALAIVKVCMSGDGGSRDDGDDSNDKKNDNDGSSSGKDELLLLPRATNVACFDSQFHATMPAHVSTYPINQDVAGKNGLRKYGFHGISYQFITEAVAAHLGKPAARTSIIALHLGSGASACAVSEGKSVDTSMGLTPLAGLPGATRSGSVDPSLVFHYASDVGKLSPSSTKDLHISRAEEILNKESGWKALTGTTDFGVIAASSSGGDGGSPKHKLAFDMFVDRVCGYVGSYYVALRGGGRARLRGRDRREERAAEGRCHRQGRVSGFRGRRGEERGQGGGSGCGYRQGGKQAQDSGLYDGRAAADGPAVHRLGGAVAVRSCASVLNMQVRVFQLPGAIRSGITRLQ
ncbi:acetate kinase [Microdochium nivale]|nr:acetate kinase [Microdochium nivale]